MSNSILAFAGERGVVKCDALNVRVSPTTQSEIVSKLYNGASFDIVYTDNGWYNIRMNNGVTGFVSAEYVKKVKETDKNVTNDALAASIVNSAHNYIGYPYSYGSTGPNAFDCSGFTSFIYKNQGITLPRSSYEQGNYGTYIEKSDLLPGDLVFFSNRRDRKINHVGIYIGNNEIIHASTSGRGVVKDSLSTNYFANNYVTARRVL